MSAGTYIHPRPPIPVRVTLPPGYVPCPACGRHYAREGTRPRRTRCERFA